MDEAPLYSVTRQKAKLFIPQSGTPEVYGNFMLSLNSDADKR